MLHLLILFAIFTAGKADSQEHLHILYIRADIEKELLLMPTAFSAMTLDEYKERILANDKGESRNQSFPAQAYAALVYYPKQRMTPTSTIEHGKAFPSPNSFVVLHDLHSKSVLQFDADEGISSFQNFPVHEDRNHVLFIRGYPSPKWLEMIGAKYMVDPELFQRHLYFQSLAAGELNHYSYPSVPSTKAKIFDLCITTIVSKDTLIPGYGPDDVEDLRRAATKATAKHHRELKVTARVADTVVRKHSILTKQLSVIEQTVSIEVVSTGKGWHGRSFQHTKLLSYRN